MVVDWDLGAWRNGEGLGGELEWSMHSSSGGVDRNGGESGGIAVGLEEEADDKFNGAGLS